MTLSNFKHYCEQKQPCIIIYNDVNDREKSPYNEEIHFGQCRFSLVFDNITIFFNPNTIHLWGDCGSMCINNVNSVTVTGGCVLGDIATVSAGTGNTQHEYTLIIR